MVAAVAVPGEAVAQPGEAVEARAVVAVYAAVVSKRHNKPRLSQGRPRPKRNQRLRNSAAAVVVAVAAALEAADAARAFLLASTP